MTSPSLSSLHPEAALPADLSIVVCTHNRAATLAGLLAALAPQLRDRPVELIVVDSASAPAEAQAARILVAAYPGARLVRLDEPGVSRARNAGLCEARAPWLGFIDDDERPGPTWVADALALRDRLPADCAACGGNVLPVLPAPYAADHAARLGARWLRYLSTIAQVGEFDQTAAPHFGIGHALLRAEAVRGIGGFDQRLGRVGGSLLSGEEVLLVRQLAATGWRIWHSDRISVGHLIEPERLTRAWVKRRAYWEGVTTAGVLRIDAPGRLHRRMAAILAKSLPLALVAPFARQRGEVDLRLAFAHGFLRAYAAALEPGLGKRHAKVLTRPSAASPP